MGRIPVAAVLFAGVQVIGVNRESATGAMLPGIRCKARRLKAKLLTEPRLILDRPEPALIPGQVHWAREFTFPSKQKASGMVYQRDWWRVAGFIMEKPEKHGLVHNGKARKTRSCSSWGILETTRGCSHSEPPACWRPFQKHCFSSPDFAFCHALFLTVFPAEFQV